MEVWDYCFDCGCGLTDDMKEDKDWFEVRGPGESYPVCRKCWEKSCEAKFRDPSLVD